jgi:hypothetical protein
MTRVAWETLKMTFLLWVVIDPLIGVVEMLLPASRRHRAARTQWPATVTDSARV